jgi:hypothetical protein
MVYRQLTGVDFAHVQGDTRGSRTRGRRGGPNQNLAQSWPQIVSHHNSISVVSEIGLTVN